MAKANFTEAVKDYDFHRMLFPEVLLYRGTGKPVSGAKPIFDLACEGVKKRYSELKQTYPEKFEFGVLSSVFASFLKSHPPLPGLVDIPSGEEEKKRFHFYDHDGVKYRATIETRTGTYEEQSGALGFMREVKWLTLRLANNGFLYPSEADLPVAVTEREIGRHHSKGPTWCVLDEAVFEKIADLTAFGEAFLTPAWATLYYNHCEDRADFEMLDESGNMLQICFERGYTCHNFGKGAFRYVRK